MKKLIKNIFFFTVPVFIICFFIYTFNVIYLDFKFAHQTSYVYQNPYSWQKYLLFSKIKRFKNKLFQKSKLENFPRIDFYVSEQSQRKLLSGTPNSTKNWVSASILNDNNLQDIQLRFRGDNPGNWLKYKKTFRIKTKKNELINGYRRFDYHLLDAIYFIPFLISEKMGLVNQSAKIVDIFINGESNGLFVQHEKMDELFLRKNKLMPVNIYKGSNNSQERHIGLNTNLFNNSEMWTKLSHFNQQDFDDKSDLNKFFQKLNSNKKNPSSNLDGFIDLEYFAKFEAFLTILQNEHHYWRDNLRLIVDPWSGHITQLITDPILGSPKKVSIDFSTNDLNSFLNKNSEFIHKKYYWLYHYLKKEKLINQVKDYTKKIENDLIIADQKEPYEPGDKNFTNSFEAVINNLFRIEKEILNILEKKPYSEWAKNENNFSIILNDITPLHHLSFYFEKDFVPEWVGLDINNDQKISPSEPKFFKKDNLSRIDLPITLYSNRLKSTINSSKIDHDLKVNFSKTKFNFISSNSSAPSKILGKNFFTRNKFQINLVNKVDGVMISKFNKILYSKNSINNKIILNGKIIVDKDLIFDQQVLIKPGTIFEIKPEKNIIFKNKILSNGTKDMPVIFKKYGSNFETNNNWGVVALLGKKTNGSILNYTNFTEGSGGRYNQFKFTSMFAIHNAEDIKIINSKFSKNKIFDDAIHVVYSNNIIFDKIEISDAFSDGIDVDISNNIIIRDILIKNSKNDGIDFMESNAIIENAKIYKSEDKGVSIGENSSVSIKNSSIIDNNIGIAVKDNSSSTIEKSNIENNNIQIAAYAKNWQYGNGGKVKVLYSKIRSKENNFNTNSDPDESDGSDNKDLIQNSEIELINSSIDGKIIVKGENFTYNK